MQSPNCIKILQQQCVVPAGQAGSPWAAQLPGPSRLLDRLPDLRLKAPDQHPPLGERLRPILGPSPAQEP